MKIKFPKKVSEKKIISFFHKHNLLYILENTKTIAMIGLSSSWQRPSYFVAKYLLDRGYKIFPVNPREAGKTILKQKVYSNLSEINSSTGSMNIPEGLGEELTQMKQTINELNAKYAAMLEGMKN